MMVSGGYMVVSCCFAVTFQVEIDGQVTPQSLLMPYVAHDSRERSSFM